MCLAYSLHGLVLGRLPGFGRSPLDGVDLAVTVINVPFGDDHFG